ncbi:TIR domain-containing protein [Lichenihabitans sp. Uapishka_5]|uniref:TIR domain-containing protein n=1 Tax=Lichenihabitans sp. Uapishka_5 TaxID=3037302 RepID=UPI0029E7D8A4|nr:TIR domain-containing protein [Lichenihabitans sp. Uapishka_5]MDX7951144.1 TIR domain-containing protein [Lichenihabitans sp. Uapishka_5]
MTVRLFVSYSHKDEAFRVKLKTHLAALERDGLGVFYDGDITPGKALDAEIMRKLKGATIFIALASPDYLASRYCFMTEYQYALRRAARGTMHVVVAILRPCQWKHTRMGHYKSLPVDGKEVTRWANRDAAFEDIVNGLRRVIAEAKAGDQATSQKAITRASSPRQRQTILKPSKSTSAKASPAKQSSSTKTLNPSKVSSQTKALVAPSSSSPKRKTKTLTAKPARRKKSRLR